MGHLFWLFIFVLATGCGTTAKKREVAELHLRMGTALLQQGKNPQAIAELRTGLSHDPDSPLLHTNLGLAYYLRGEPALAAKHLKKAIELKPDYAEARNNLSRVLAEQGQYEESISQADWVIADLTYSHPEKAHLNKGIALFKAARFEKAKESFRTSLEIKKDSCIAQNYYGRSLYELSKFDQASKVFDSAIALCRPQGFDEPHYYSALTFYKMGNQFQARTRFNEVIEYYPNGKYGTESKDMLKLIR